MQLPSFLTRHQKKESKKDYTFTLLLSEDSVSCGLWYVAGGSVDIIGKAVVSYRGGWDAVIDASDRALSEASESLPEETVVHRVIFGLSPQYIKGDRIVPDYLTGLKKLCQELDLNPSGFVVTPEAIAFLLQKKEGSPPTTILIGFGRTSLTMSLFKVGKPCGFATVARTDSLIKDIEQALASFVDVEIMPSRILLYDGEITLTKAREELLTYPWQKKSAFLHFPKIEPLESDVAIEAVAVAGASEMTSNTLLKEVVDEEGGLITTLAEKPHPPEEADVSKKHKESDIVEPSVSETHEETFGFVSSEVTHEEKKDQERPRMEVVVTENGTAHTQSGFRLPITKPSLPSFAFPQFSIPWPKNIRMTAIFFAIFLFLFGGVLISLYWTYPAATVTLLVDPYVLRREIDVTLDPSITDVDDVDNRIRGIVVESEAKGSKRAAVTDKKMTGERAKGVVTMYNKTTGEKTFPKGTMLVGPKGLKFTLDEVVSVASMSDVIVGTPGKQTGSVTASGIGSESNVPAGSDFSLEGFPLTSYAGRNEKAFAGGSSREVQAVGKADQDQLLKALSSELIVQTKAQLGQKLGAGEQFVDQSLTTTVGKKTFNHDIGNEAAELSLDATITVKGIAYARRDLSQIAKKHFSEAIPSGYTFNDQEVSADVLRVTGRDDGIMKVTMRLAAKLMPVISVESIRKNLVGKSIEQSEAYLKEQKGIVGFAVAYTKTLLFTPKSLPHLISNLTVRVAPR